MENKEYFNELVKEVIGLDFDCSGNLVDPNTSTLLQFKGKNIKMGHVSRDEVEFDPLNNPRMMSNLFSYFVNKLNDEDSNKYVSTFYSSPGEKGDKGYIELKEGENTIKSGLYYNDSIKYADLMVSLNGGTPPEELHGIDSFTPPPQRR